MRAGTDGMTQAVGSYEADRKSIATKDTKVHKRKSDPNLRS
jgi:hypothetical protein